jgi:hypothetical protein
MLLSIYYHITIEQYQMINTIYNSTVYIFYIHNEKNPRVDYLHHSNDHLFECRLIIKYYSINTIET